MSYKCEKIDNNKVRLIFPINPEELEEGIKYSYNKNKSKINIQGFRKGRAPRKIIEMNYGKEIFYDDALNFIIPKIYESIIKKESLEVVSRPNINLEEVSSEKGAVIKAEVYIKPKVIIENDFYKGITYDKIDLNVSEEEINKEIEKVREQNSRILSTNNKSIEIGDIVTIDFEGFIDGVAFDGGKGKDYDLTIGSKTFIDTFEDQLIGYKIGDSLNVDVKFPENYYKEDLKNREAIFKVDIKDIKSVELPTLDDDFAQDVSEFETLVEYKNDIKRKILREKELNAKKEIEEKVIKSIVEKIKIDIPDIMVENQIDSMINEFSNQIKMQGINLEAYLQYVGQDIESLRKSYKDNALLQVQARLILEEIAKKENLDVTEEEFNNEINYISEKYSIEKERLFKSLTEDNKKGIINDIKIKKALNIVIENSVEV